MRVSLPLFLAMAVLSIPGRIQAQTYLAMFSNGSNLVNSAVSQTGNTVSIGGATSLGALTLINSVPSGDAPGMALYNSAGGGGASVSLDMYNTYANAGIPQAKIKAIDDGYFSDHLTFWTKLPGAANHPITEKMRITSTGNVGIGTPNPQQRLEVNGNALVDGNLTVSGSIFSSGSVGRADDGRNDFAAGTEALPSTSTGGQNTAVGYAVLASNTSGSQNTALGQQALWTNTSGSSNTAIGSGALFGNTTGTGNTIIGQQALPANSTGIGNTVIGSEALLYNQSGNYNIAIGYVSGGYLINGSQNIYLGQVPAGQSDNGVIRIGNASNQTSTYIAGIYGVTPGINNGVPVVIDSNGQLGAIVSSRRFKEDIHDMGDASAALMRLRPVTFRYRQPFADGSKPVQYGLIAEEVAEVYPDLVSRSANGKIESVKYQLLDPMLLNEVQRLNRENAAQAEKIQNLEQRLLRLESVLAKSVALEANASLNTEQAR